MKKQKPPSMERMYDIIRRPLVTEKTSRGSEFNKVTFEVSLDATKPEIKAAVETLFQVKVSKVNTMVRKGKVRRFRGTIGRTSDFKRAIVTLEEGSAIELASAV